MLVLNIKKVSDTVLFPKNPIPQPGWKKKQPVRCKKRPSQVVTVQSEFLCFSRAAGTNISVPVTSVQKWLAWKTTAMKKQPLKEKIYQGFKTEDVLHMAILTRKENCEEQMPRKMTGWLKALATQSWQRDGTQRHAGCGGCIRKLSPEVGRVRRITKAH